MQVYNFYDWDDTLVYTREAQFRAYRDSVRHYLNIQISWDDYNKSFYGNSNSYLMQLGCNSSLIKKIKSLKQDLFLNKYQNYVEVLVKSIPEDHLNIIVSNSDSSTIRRLIEDLNLDFRFLRIIGKDSFEGLRLKPAADLYHLAYNSIGNFNLEADQLNIYEDSRDGLFAALKFSEEIRLRHLAIVYKPVPATR